MIPVRVPAGTLPHVVESGGRFIPDRHPFGDRFCPVCDRRLAGQPCSLVYVGAKPAGRTSDRWYGSAILVHDTCALDDGAPRPAIVDPIRPSALDPHDVVDTLDELALALGGSTSTTGEILRLADKFDQGNRDRLRLAFPRTVRAYELWLANVPMTAGRLLAALDDGLVL